MNWTFLKRLMWVVIISVENVGAQAGRDECFFLGGLEEIVVVHRNLR